MSDLATVIAIDPGNSGGLAVWASGITGIRLFSMPETPGDVRDLLRGLIEQNGGTLGVRCYLEKVGGFVKGNPTPGSAMFCFGRGYGHLEMALLCLGIPTVSVTPQAWQKTAGVGTRGQRKAAEWKRVLKARAQQLFPTAKVSLATADAALILWHALREERQEIS